MGVCEHKTLHDLADYHREYPAEPDQREVEVDSGGGIIDGTCHEVVLCMLVTST